MPSLVKRIMPFCASEVNWTSRARRPDRGPGAQVLRRPPSRCPHDFESFQARLDMVDARLCRTNISGATTGPPTEAAAKSASTASKAKAGAGLGTCRTPRRTVLRKNRRRPLSRNLCSEVTPGEVVFQVVGDRLTTTGVPPVTSLIPWMSPS